MARISGVTIPDGKQVHIALDLCVWYWSKDQLVNILAKAKVEPTARVKNLTDAEISRIQDVINEDYTVEGELQRDCSW